MSPKIASVSVKVLKDKNILISVPKKIFRTAVERNKVKRIIRESLRSIKTDIPVIKDYEIKVMPTRYILTEDFVTITEQIKNQIKKYV